MLVFGCLAVCTIILQNFVEVNKYIKFKKVKGTFLNLMGIQIITFIIWIFYFDKEELKNGFDNHERLHCLQWLECGIFLFPIFYFFESILKSLMGLGYQEISFEREAYLNQNNINYLDDRKSYAWLRYILPFRKKKVDMTKFRTKKAKRYDRVFKR